MNIEFVIDDTGSKDREDGAEIQVLAKEENIRFVPKTCLPIQEMQESWV